MFCGVGRWAQAADMQTLGPGWGSWGSVGKSSYPRWLGMSEWVRQNDKEQQLQGLRTWCEDMSLQEVEGEARPGAGGMARRIWNVIAVPKFPGQSTWED